MAVTTPFHASRSKLNWRHKSRTNCDISSWFMMPSVSFSSTCLGMRALFARGGTVTLGEGVSGTGVIAGAAIAESAKDGREKICLK